MSRSHQHEDPDRGKDSQRNKQHVDTAQHVALPLTALPVSEGSDS
jgi:hypothetical protein